jgi:hypothetical protein
MLTLHNCDFYYLGAFGNNPRTRDLIFIRFKFSPFMGGELTAYFLTHLFLNQSGSLLALIDKEGLIYSVGLTLAS